MTYEKSTNILVGESGDVGLNVGRILKWMVRKPEVTLWSGFVWLRIRPRTR
jgi:hypothetical protein